jgi:hypothetical protein
VLEINDCQATMSESNVSAGVNPNTCVIRASMSDQLAHHCEPAIEIRHCPVSKVNNRCKTAHKKLRKPSFYVWRRQN